MTKYILNSGGLRNQPELSKKFFAEIVKGLGNNPRILMCLFAIPRQYWEQKFSEDMLEMPRLFPAGVSPLLELVFPKSFVDQVKKSDVIYIRGGDDHLVQYWLRKYDLPAIWDGKVVAGGSAGSDVLATRFWTGEWRENMDGLGILPIKFLAHFKSAYGDDDPRGPIDWDAAYKSLEAYGDQSLPVHALKEGEFVVIQN